MLIMVVRDGQPGIDTLGAKGSHSVPPWPEPSERQRSVLVQRGPGRDQVHLRGIMDWRNEARLCREDGHPYAALAAMAYALFGWHLTNGTRPLCEVNPDAWDELDQYRRTLGLPDWAEIDLS